jgi:hypothetical protein
MVAILCCISVFWLFGQNVEVTLQSTKSEVAVGEKFNVVLTANVKGTGNVKMPESFEVLASMNGSSSSSINGKQSYEATLTITVIASQKGTFTIPAATWKYGLNKKAKSNELKITVKEGSGSTSNTTNVYTPKPESNGNHYAVFSSSRNEVYVGEPFVITGRIYFDGHIVDANSIKMYESDMMMHKSDVAGNNGALNVTGEQYKGRMYESILLFEDLIVPQQAGALNFDPFSINLGFQRGFFNTGYKLLTSNVLKVKVLPLPENAPRGFQGALGKYTIRASHDIDGVLNAGDLFTYKVRVEGSGNIHMLKPIALNLPKGLILYGDPVVDNQVQTTKKGSHGHIDYEFIIQVQNGGSYNFAPIEFAYFNPDTKAYQTIKVDNLSFTAEGDELPTENDENDEITSQTSSSSWWLNGLLLVLASGVIGIGVVYFLNKNKLNTQSSKTKKLKVDARAVAMKSLEIVPTANLKETADALEKIILQYFRDLTMNDELLLDKSWFIDEASKFNIPAALASNWAAHFDNIQAIKYAGFGSLNAEELVGKTRELVG